jgi:hypothetical protein
MLPLQASISLVRELQARDELGLGLPNIFLRLSKFGSAVRP